MGATHNIPIVIFRSHYQSGIDFLIANNAKTLLLFWHKLIIAVILIVRYEVFVLGSRSSVVNTELGYTSSLGETL
jgi:cell shape-determining protein MreD